MANGLAKREWGNRIIGTMPLKKDNIFAAETGNDCVDSACSFSCRQRHNLTLIRMFK